MDFYPPRSERPGRGVGFVLIAIPIGVLGFWFASWSLLLTGLFMVFLGLVEVLLYRSGARARVIRSGRTPLLVTGSLVVILSAAGGSAIVAVRASAAAGLDPRLTLITTTALGGQPESALLAALIGAGGGIASLIYFTRRFSVPGGADPR